jgi:uncharacterized protein YbbC (DUF1343 family)
MQSHVLTGIDQLVANNFQAIRGRRVGAIVNQASVDSRFGHLADYLKSECGKNLVRIFGPEHGFAGVAQDLESVDGPPEANPRWGVPVYSLYGATEATLTPKRELLADIETLVVDLPDIGSRYYTFAATLIRTIRAAIGLGLEILVLDRPNPLGGMIKEGPVLKPGFESFVGEIAIPIRHGMTLGEIGQWVIQQEKLDVQLTCISCQNWDRNHLFPQTGLPWVIPSPNMPTFDTALVYPGGCLIEGTNLSEGRGTTRPFEIFGAPWLNELELANDLNASGLSGYIARPTQFKPTFQKHVGIVCNGVQIHVTDPIVFQPVRVYTAAIIAARKQNPDLFRWRTETYEFRDNPIAIDLLYGSDRERTMIESGAGWQEIAAGWGD